MRPYKNMRISEETHRKLKVLAAQRGLSFDALLGKLAEEASDPTVPYAPLPLGVERIKVAAAAARGPESKPGVEGKP